MALPVINRMVYTVDIPSTKQTIEYTPYNVKQEKNLMLAKESGSDKKVAHQTKQLIKECVLTEGVDIDSLPTFDIELLFLHIRCKSVGETAKLAAKCEKCDYANEVDIDLSAVTITNPVATKEQMNIIVSDEQGVGVTVRYPTLNDLLKIEGDGSQSIYKLIISCITHIYTAEEVFDCSRENKKDVEEFVGSLYEGQFKNIAAFFEAMPVIQLSMDYTCAKCEHKYSNKVEGLANFFT